MTELVLLVGPPLVGKTLYCQGHFSVHYTRISIREELEQNPEVGLRFIINKAVTQLKQGKNVVIDDENGSKSKRQSFIKVIKDKVPGCSLRCINLTPKSGHNQLLWSLAYQQAHWLEKQDYKNQVELCPYRENMLDQWVMDKGGGGEKPSYGEGFNKIDDVSLDFIVHSYYKFEVPCLFIQYEAVMKLESDLPVDGVTTALELWCSANTCGCVIFIYGHVAGTQPKDKYESMRKTLKGIITKLPSIPLFTLSIDSVLSGSSFFAVANSGIVALCGRLFHLDLSHQATMYLYSTQDHLRCAEKAGVRYNKAARIFQHPKMVTSYSMATSPSVPDVIKSLKVTWPKKDVIMPTMPLLDREPDEIDSMFYTSCKLNGNMSLHLCANSRESCESFHNRYQEHATPITEDGSRLDELQKQKLVSVIQDFEPTLEADDHHHSVPKSRRSSTMSTSSDTSGTAKVRKHQDLPKWMVKKNAQDVLNTPKKDRKSPKKMKSQICTTIYVMSPAELLDTAKSILKQAEDESELESLSTLPRNDSKAIFNKPKETPRKVLTPVDIARIESDLEKESFKFEKEDFDFSLERKSSIDDGASCLPDDTSTSKPSEKLDLQETCLDEIFIETQGLRKKKPPKTRAVKRSPIVSDEEDRRPSKVFASKTKRMAVTEKKKEPAKLKNDFSFLDEIF